MVILNVNVMGKDKPLYMDGGLHKQLIDVVRPDVKKKDFDYVLIVDGEEGSGKSVFSMHIAKVLDPEFDISQVCFTPNEFINAVTSARKFSCIVFDEGFTGLSSRASLSEVNNLIVSLMMEMRQKNLFIIIVMPTFFMLERYVVLHRAKGLFHVYMRNGERGYWGFFNKPRLKIIWIEGKKYFSYGARKYRMFGRFRDQYVVDEQAYRLKKRNSFSLKKRTTRSDIYKKQRDKVIYSMVKVLGMTHQQVTDTLFKVGYSMDRSNIKFILQQIQKTSSFGEQIPPKNFKNPVTGQ